MHGRVDEGDGAVELGLAEVEVAARVVEEEQAAVAEGFGQDAVGDTLAGEVLQQSARLA